MGDFLGLVKMIFVFSSFVLGWLMFYRITMNFIYYTGTPKYTSVYFCVNCNRILSEQGRMYNYGTCPYCGYHGKNACTITDTYVRSAKWIRCKPWWYIWNNKGHWLYKEDENKPQA